MPTPFREAYPTIDLTVPESISGSVILQLEEIQGCRRLMAPQRHGHDTTLTLEVANQEAARAIFEVALRYLNSNTGIRLNVG